MRPLSACIPVPSRVYRTVKTQPITESGLLAFSIWIKKQTWSEVYECGTAHKMAEKFQSLLMENFQKCFPIKMVKFCDDDRPWFSKSLKQLDRARKREFFKHQKSEKWIKLNQEFLQKCSEEKEKYHKNIVQDLKESNISQWYSKVKRMAGQDQQSEFTVEELLGLSDLEQAEKIAEHYSGISSLYKPLQNEDFPDYENPSLFSPPIISASKVSKIIQSMNQKASAVPGDLPMKVIAQFSNDLSNPLAHLINKCLRQGQYPDLWKIEYVTPVPKKFPPEKLKDLRKISGLLNFSKITDKILAQFIAEDIESKRDKAQYGNQKQISIQHYLVNMLHKILTSVDDNSTSKSVAVILQMVDWSQAFDRQCHSLGIKSFIDNGVRHSLIPILMNFFQDREMVVKWRGLLSKSHPLPGGGPQGGTLGTEEYLSQSNRNTDFLDQDEKFKFIDDLSILEILNLISIGLASYNFREHVPSDIGADNYFLDPRKIRSQGYLDKIESWTQRQKMKLNKEKTSYMIFNFSKKYQFNTRLKIEETTIEQVHETRLLGLVLRDDLSWISNTHAITKRAYARMIILRNLYSFNIPVPDLVQLYILYIRSIVEQSAVVWHSSITKGEQKDIERVQKVALRIILKDGYQTYVNALRMTGLETLAARRTKLCLNFARKCLKNEKTANIFPLNELNVNTRNPEKYHVTPARTDRLAKSSIPYMQRLLNANRK